MAKYLEAFIEKQNIMAGFFKQKILDINNLSEEDKVNLGESLSGALSPENLCCDGELRGAALRKKTKELMGAAAELEAMGITLSY